MADDLSEPLTRGGAASGTPAKTRGPKAMRIVNWAAGTLVLVGVALTAITLLRLDQLGGEPVVYVNLKADPPPVVSGTSSAGSSTALGGLRPGVSDGTAEGAPGNDGSGEPGVAIITRLDTPLQPGETAVTAADGTPLPANPDATTAIASLPSSADQRVIERATIGLLPRIGAKGEKPSEIYARPSALSPTLGGGEPARVAILVGGLGISASATDEAIQRLPEAISLAFAPYGRDLQNRVNRARQQGHEVLLQLPMEPFDYPDNDPGPHTLLTAARTADNLERLHWLMARFTGYFGVTNYMGAKFSSSSEDLTPIFKELAARGLAFIDDGSSPRSQVTSVASGVGLPARRSDLVIDAGQTKRSIEEALRQLEAIALERGYAIGSATALPATLDAIAAWSKGLAERGIIIVPVSAAMRSGPQS